LKIEKETEISLLKEKLDKQEKALEEIQSLDA